MELSARRRRGAPKPRRINLYLTDRTYEQLAEIAQRRGIENGAAARVLIEERLGQMAWSPEHDPQREPVAV